MMKYFLVCLALSAAVVKADDFESLELDEASQPRIFGDLFNTTATTPDFRSVIAFLLIMVLVLTSSGSIPGLPLNRGDNDYNNYGYNQDQYGQSYSRRSGLFDDDTASRMHQLEMAFKKFSVEEEACKMFVACESAQLNKLRNAIPVVQFVSKIFRRRDDGKTSPSMERINSAYAMGSEGHSNNVPDVCGQLKKSCYAAYNTQ